MISHDLLHRTRFRAGRRHLTRRLEEPHVELLELRRRRHRMELDHLGGVRSGVVAGIWGFFLPGVKWSEGLLRFFFLAGATRCLHDATRCKLQLKK